MVMLICEGYCNPTLPDVDRRVGFVLLGTGKLAGVAVGHYGIWDEQRRLRYTEHQQDSVDHARCQLCGHRRRWGNQAGLDLYGTPHPITPPAVGVAVQPQFVETSALTVGAK
jgi:hypothetical protein